MRKISSQSMQTLDSLIQGEELSIGSVSIKLPEDEFSIPAMQTLIERYQQDISRASQEDAKQLLDKVKELTSDSTTSQEEPTPTDSEQPEPSEKPKWRLHKLKAHNFRGLTEWDGNAFEWDFEERPWFICGPNGSGKTSIIGALVWCLTGHCLREREEPESESPCLDIFNGKAEKDCILVGDWPLVATVPHNLDPDTLRQVKPNCWVEVELKSNHDVVYICRSISETGGAPSLVVKDESGNEINWTDLKISSLDSELSLLLPMRVPSIKFEEGSKISEQLMAVPSVPR